jgi:hypothetical protein
MGGKVFTGARQQNFVGAGLVLARLLPQEPYQQILRCASKISDARKIINPNGMLTCQVKNAYKCCLIKATLKRVKNLYVPIAMDTRLSSKFGRQKVCI